MNVPISNRAIRSGGEQWFDLVLDWPDGHRRFITSFPDRQLADEQGGGRAALLRAELGVPLRVEAVGRDAA